MKRFDVLVLGAGFYGCCIAASLAEKKIKVALIEKEHHILRRASSINQARVHGGYHYPRSFMTATRSFVNYWRFLRDFKPAIRDEFKHIYAISRYGSKINAKQFYNLFKKLGAPLQKISSTVMKELFNLHLVEDAFLVEEALFDWSVLEKLLLEKLSASRVHLFLDHRAIHVEAYKEQLVVSTDKADFLGSQVLSCLYAGLNAFQENSHFSALPLKFEWVELACVKPVTSLEKFAVTLMDGPFFSLLPYPQNKLMTLSHVRYSPHRSWTENISPIQSPASQFIYMQRDAARYMPILKELQYVTSLYEIKTILQRHEMDDGRPILMREEPMLKNFFTIMGSKLDNIYDALDIIKDKVPNQSQARQGERVW